MTISEPRRSRPEITHLPLQPYQAATWMIILLATTTWIWFAAGGITWYDSGELVAAAWHLGLSHPPGQPLYGIIGRLASFLPLGSIAFRCNILSALAGGAALAGLARLARQDAGDKAALIAVSLAAMSWPLAEQTMRAEVYAPVLAAILWALALARDPRHAQVSRLGAASLLMGLASGFHPLVAALAWLGLAVAVTASRGLKRKPAALVALLAGATLGNFIWLTLPAAGNRPELLPWTQLDNLRGILDTVTARAYRQNFSGGHLALSMRLIANSRLASELAGPALTLAGLLGFFGLAIRKGKPLGLGPAWILLPVGLAATSTFTVFYPMNPDIHGYLLPTISGLALASGVGLVRLSQALLSRVSEQRRTWLSHLGTATAGLVVASSAWGNARPIADQTHRLGRTDRFAAAVAESARPGPGLVVASSDHALFALVYAKTVEQWRPDLALVSQWLLGADAPWYRRWVKRTWPWLFVPLVDDQGPTRGTRLRFEMTNAARMPTYLENPNERLWPLLEDCGLFFALMPAGNKKNACLRKAFGPKVLAPIQARLIGCYMACGRARFLASRGHLTEAARLLDPFLRRPLPGLPPLASEFLCTGARPLVLAARIRTAQGARRGAEKLLLQAMELDPRFSDTYVELGRILAADGHLQKARAMEIRGLELDPTNVTGLFYLALIEQRLGRLAQAEALLRRALALNPDKVRLLLRAHGAASPVDASGQPGMKTNSRKPH